MVGAVVVGATGVVVVGAVVGVAPWPEWLEDEHAANSDPVAMEVRARPASRRVREVVAIIPIVVAGASSPVIPGGCGRAQPRRSEA
jgi:hypothetical protein